MGANSRSEMRHSGQMVLLTGSWGELAGQWNALTKDLSAVQKAAMVTVYVVLDLPLVRMSLEPLALAWNRHR